MMMATGRAMSAHICKSGKFMGRHIPMTMVCSSISRRPSGSHTKFNWPSVYSLREAACLVVYILGLETVFELSVLSYCAQR